MGKKFEEILIEFGWLILIIIAFLALLKALGILKV